MGSKNLLFCAIRNDWIVENEFFTLSCPKILSKAPYPFTPLPDRTFSQIISPFNFFRKQTVTSDQDCDSNVDVKVYEITFGMGLIFSVIYFTNGLVINSIGKKNLLSFWFFVCGICCTFLAWAQNFRLILFLMVTFLVLGVCGSILSVILVDMYPTNIRWVVEEFLF